jgi:uncharacterized protein YqeY
VVILIVLGTERLEQELIRDEPNRRLEVVRDEGHPDIVALGPQRRRPRWYPTSIAAVEPVREQLTTALRAAMKARDRAQASVLRSTLAAIENAEAIEDDDGRLVDEDARIAGSVGWLGAGEARRAVVDEQAARAIVAREAQERRAAAEEYERLGRGDEAARLRDEADLLAAFA